MAEEEEVVVPAAAAATTESAAVEEPPAAATTVKVHPLVVFSILDHFIRRQEGQERVIGTLLGSRDEATVEVQNAFAVPHSEKEGEVAVGQATNKTMSGLLARVNASEKIVGWYATTPPTPARPINDSTSLIHDFYLQECEEPVHLVVDTSMADGIRLRAFAAPRTGADASRAFVEVSCSLVFADFERDLLETMTSGIVNDPLETGSSLSVLPSRMNAVETSVEHLLGLLDDVSEYCEDVASNKKKVHPEAARHIADALATLPHLDATDVDAAFNANMQDIVMVSYLASVTKTQLAIAAKIHATF
ncbi:hypothetical protein CTAYLR_000496 [Chrysophaeum taylorii]|uniref:MPN domain-containing protein n=1 Tax=Chrysophaeum taylorii TaxID=2483200 RepID=A0AAD7UI88_9STRA|nr:hypothetical protein CTAYLR_000496 [Chrysophaeum taylorii]